MNNFIDLLFPTDIAYNTVGGPTFSTIINSTQNNNEFRSIKWPMPRYRYTITYGTQNQDHLRILVAFFIMMKGRGLGFRYRDWVDYRGENEYLGNGNNLQQEFQLVKHYKISNYSTVRTIYKPVKDSVKLRSSDELPDYEIDYSNGIIKFVSPIPLGQSLFADFEFDVPVRFNNDGLPFAITGKGTFVAKEIELIEIT